MLVQHLHLPTFHRPQARWGLRGLYPEAGRPVVVVFLLGPWFHPEFLDVTMVRSFLFLNVLWLLLAIDGFPIDSSRVYRQPFVHRTYADALYNGVRTNMFGRALHQSVPLCQQHS